jgi:rare lipoprotein A
VRLNLFSPTRQRGHMIQSWTRASAHTAACALAIASVTGTANNAAAKTPGKTYCFHGHCHTVKTIAETQALVGKTQVIKASFYDDPKNDRYNPSNITSSGAYFRSDKADNAASPILPDGTKAVVWNPRTKKAAMIRINNAGPYWGDRKIDLSRATAEKIGITTGGVGTVHLKVVEAPTKSEASYQRGRTYAPVKGFLGAFADLDAAIVSIGRSIFGQPPAPAKEPVVKSTVVAEASPAKPSSGTNASKPASTKSASTKPVANKPVVEKPIATKVVAKVDTKPSDSKVASKSVPAPKPIVVATKLETKPEAKPVVAALRPAPQPDASPTITTVKQVQTGATKVSLTAMEVRVKNAEREAERQAAVPRTLPKSQRRA